MSKQLITRKGIAELVRRRFAGSQTALARALKADASTISRWIRGPSTPDWPTQILLKQWLDEARPKPKELNPSTDLIPNRSGAKKVALGIRLAQEKPKFYDRLARGASIVRDEVSGRSVPIVIQWCRVVAELRWRNARRSEVVVTTFFGVNRA
jgi:hypothetical protein